MPYRELVEDGEVWVVFSTQPVSGANVRPQYANGWLSFHRGAERRRLSPIPSDWENADDAQLLAWLEDSEPVAQAGDEDDRFRAARPEPAGTRAEGQGRRAADPPRMEREESGAATRAAASSSRVKKSIERIRAMLSDIRRDGI